LADARKEEEVGSGHIIWQAIWYQLAEDDIMYLLETGFGQPYRQRDRSRRPSRPAPKAPVRRAPKDRFEGVLTTWVLEVPFRQDYKAFRKEVVTAIGRHVAAKEKTKIDGLIPDVPLKKRHDNIPKSTAESDFVSVKVELLFQQDNYTGLKDILIWQGP
jgi:hypothetical protein